LQSDHKVLAGGDFTTFAGVSRNLIVRLEEDGNVDPTFHPDTGSDGTVVTLAAQTDGKLLLGGILTTVNATNRIGILRLTAEGSLDDTFNGEIEGSKGVNSLVLQPDGKVLIGGVDGGTKKGYVSRLNVDGSLDGTFITTEAD